MPIYIPHHQNKKRSISIAALRDFVVGISDGLTVPFALSAGLSGAVHSNSIVIMAGLTEIIAGTISMGLGGFLAGKTELDNYRNKKRGEEKEVKEVPKEEENEIKNLLETYGISPGLRKAVAKELSKDHAKWVDFMMRFELGLEKPDSRQALVSAIRIGLSYAIGGLVPLSAYFFCKDPLEGLKYSSFTTILCLLLFGYVKGRFTQQDPIKEALAVTFIGIVAAGAAFGIARMVNS